jgi:2-dehydro-3-deoxyphosphooctonate aldolase (KDO 8-P synthase)
MRMKKVTIGGLTVGNDCPLLVIAGPCQLESLDHAQMIAGILAEACRAAGAQYVFKASYDKANRTSLTGKRGLGMEAGLKVLAAVRAMGMPVLTDVHDAGQAREAASVVDVMQIPAFLCRQTDLLLAAGETGAVVNVKKGQFLAPWDMANVAAKVASTGNDRILLTERGTASATTPWSPTCAPADHGAHRLAGDHGRHPFGAAAGRPGRQLRAGSANSRRCWRGLPCRLGIAGVFIETHRRPRPRALGRAEHDPAERHARAGRQPDGVRPAGQGRSGSGVKR